MCGEQEEIVKAESQHATPSKAEAKERFMRQMAQFRQQLNQTEHGYNYHECEQRYK